MEVQPLNNRDASFLVKFKLALELGSYLQTDRIDWGLISKTTSQLFELVTDKKENIDWRHLNQSTIGYIVSPSIKALSLYLERDPQLKYDWDFFAASLKIILILLEKYKLPFGLEIKRKVFICSTLILDSKKIRLNGPALEETQLLSIKLLNTVFGFTETFVLEKKYDAPHFWTPEDPPVKLLYTMCVLLEATLSKSLRKTLLIFICSFFNLREFISDKVLLKTIPMPLMLLSKLLKRNPETESSNIFVLSLEGVKVFFSRVSSALPDESFVKTFRSVSKVILKNAILLSQHHVTQVRQSCLNLLCWSLEKPELFDVESLLGTIFELRAEPDLKHASEDRLNLLLNEPYFHNLIEKLWERKHCDLITCFVTKTHSSHYSLLKLLVGLQEFLGAELESYIFSDLEACWLTWCKCLVAEENTPTVLEKENFDLSIDSPQDAFDILKLPLKYTNDRNTKTLLFRFLKNIGIYLSHDISDLMNHGLLILENPIYRIYHGPTLFILSQLLEGYLIQNSSDKDLCRGLLPSAVFVLEDEDKTPFTACQALALITQSVNLLGYNFRTMLYSTLYAIFENVGHADWRVSRASRRTLEMIVKNCQYKDTLDLIRDNLDYLVHSLSQKLHPNRPLCQSTANMLKVLFYISRGKDLYLLDDIFDLAADGLYSAYTFSHSTLEVVHAFLEVFLAMVEPISECRGEREQKLQPNPLPLLPCAVPPAIQKLLDERRQLVELRSPDDLYTTLDDFVNNGGFPVFQHPETYNLEDKAEENEDPVLKRCNDRLGKIMKTAQCFLGHSNATARRLAVMIFGAIAKAPESSVGYIYNPLRQPLDPYWHQAWLGLKSRLDDPDITVATAILETLGRILRFSPDFLGPRFGSEILPKVMALIKSSWASLKLPPVKLSSNSLASIQPLAPLQLKGAHLILTIIQLDTHMDPCLRFKNTMCLYQLSPSTLNPIISEQLIPSLQKQGDSAEDVAWMIQKYLLKAQDLKS